MYLTFQIHLHAFTAQINTDTTLFDLHAVFNHYFLHDVYFKDKNPNEIQLNYPPTYNLQLLILYILYLL